MNRPTCCLLVAMLALPAGAAQPSHCQVIHLTPVRVAPRNKVDARALTEAAAEELGKRERKVQVIEEVHDDCMTNDDLAKLAPAPDCTAAFALKVDDDLSVELVARLIEGATPRSPILYRVQRYGPSGGSVQESAVSALRQFIRSARLPEPERQLVAGCPAGPMASAPATASQPQPFDWRLLGGAGVGLVGGGSFVTGAILRQQAAGDWSTALKNAGSRPFNPAQRSGLEDAFDAANAKDQWGRAGMLGGALLVAAGAGLATWGFAACKPPAPPPWVQATGCEDGRSRVTWGEPGPQGHGDSPITGYKVVSFPGAVTVNVEKPDVRAVDVGGLTNGNKYTFKVTAKNACAESQPTVSNEIVPRALGVPGAVEAEPGDTMARVTWLPPGANGGSSIIEYTVYSVPETHIAHSDGPATSAIVSGLTNVKAYTFYVTAINADHKQGPQSAESKPVTPFQAPGPPQRARIQVKDDQATITWAAPEANGGAPLTCYAVTTLVPGKLGYREDKDHPRKTMAVSDKPSAVIEGLKSWKSYKFQVSAANDRGWGAAVELEPPKPRSEE